MKSLLLLTLSLIFSLSSFAQNTDHPWKALEGCYQTLERNGAAVTLPADYSAYKAMYKAKIGDAWYGIVKDIHGKQVSALNWYILKNYSATDNKYINDTVVAFTDRGRYWSDHDGYHYIFKGILTYHNSQGHLTPFILKESITVKALSSDVLQVHSQRTLPEVNNGAMDANDIYVLKKIDCN